MMLSLTIPLLWLTLAGTAVAAQSSPGVDATEQSGLTRDEAVALVLATDPLYADLPDFTLLRREMAATFDMGAILGSDYYRVLDILPMDFPDGFIDFRYPADWIIEVTLVRDCSTGDGDDPLRVGNAPLPDPCAWRHAWFYRVQPDGTVSLLFDAGDATPMPMGDE